ncbi:MAG: CpsD/CapB family tyrosine-protein kinase [Pirellulales bacterium]|nr:CpsD/CapB family tyrosine-protein kinase [Pirellulales bacterium]
MSRILDALKQVEAKGGDTPTDAARPVPSAPTAQPPDATAARLEATADQIASALAAAHAGEGLPTGGAAHPTATPSTPNTPMAPTPTPVFSGRRYSDRMAGGDWLADIAGSDLRPGSRLGSQYRRLRDRILSQLPRGGAAALLFASADRQSGTTTTAIHLAAVLAEVTAGDVLVVDADGRDGDLAQRLNIDAAHGLADVLAGRVGWQEAVVRIPPGCVQVLASCAKRVPAAAELPSRLSAFLGEVKRRYRAVIVDGGMASSAEATHWPGVCDGVYLCVEFEETSTKSAAEAVSLLRRAGGRVLGCVATRATPTH